MERRFLFQCGLFLIILCIQTVPVISQEDSDQADGTKCPPGTIPNECISKGGILHIFCIEVSKCPLLSQGTATCSQTFTPSCASTAYVGAIQENGISPIGARTYYCQCCQHPAITSTRILRVFNRVLDADDSFVENLQSDGTVQIITNIYSIEKGKHVVQLAKIACTR